jgi:hypothetical protein
VKVLAFMITVAGLLTAREGPEKVPPGEALVRVRFLLTVTVSVYVALSMAIVSPGDAALTAP